MLFLFEVLKNHQDMAQISVKSTDKRKKRQGSRLCFNTVCLYGGSFQDTTGSLLLSEQYEQTISCSRILCSCVNNSLTAGIES